MRITLKASELTQDATPTPDSPQDIHTISGDNTLKVEGKNLASNTEYTDQTNIYSPMIKATYSVIKDQYYAISFDTANTDIVGYLNYNSTSKLERVGDYPSFRCDGTRKTFIAKGLDNAIVTNQFIVNRSSATSTTTTGLCSNFMIEKISSSSDTSTSYEPYVSQTAPINLDTIEYCKIGNYEDEFIYNTTDTNLELNKWYLKKNIGKVVLDGSENIFTESTNIPNEYRFKIDTGLTNIYREPNTSAISPIFCSICKSISRYQTSANIQGICYGIESDYYRDFVIYLDLAKNMTPQDFKNWLASNNVTICYVLSTPTYTLLNDTLQEQLNNIHEKLLSYKGTTNISQVNNDLPFVLGVSAIEDLE